MKRRITAAKNFDDILQRELVCGIEIEKCNVIFSAMLSFYIVVRRRVFFLSTIVLPLFFGIRFFNQ
jgi:hypothetical protein